MTQMSWGGFEPQAPEELQQLISCHNVMILPPINQETFFLGIDST